MSGLLPPDYNPAMKKTAFIRSLVLIPLVAFSLHSWAGLPGELDASLREAGISPDSLALWVAPVEGGTPVLEHQPNRAMSPASVMKLFTSQAALDLLGPGHVWKTRAWLSGPVHEGRLDGDVFIAGSGDPDLTWDRLGQWLRDWRSRGLREIRGDLLVDRLLISNSREPDFDEAPHRAYNARPDAFLVHFGALALSLRPEGGKVEAIQTIPASPLRLLNRVKAVEGACNGWRDGLKARFEPEGKGFMLTIEGRFPASCGEKTFNLAVPDSLRWAGAVIRAQWQELGGTWAGELRDASLPENPASPFSTWESPSLPEVLRDMDKWSNNVMARQIFLALGDAGQGSLSPEKTLERLRPWMKAQGLDPTKWVF